MYFRIYTLILLCAVACSGTRSNPNPNSDTHAMPTSFYDLKAEALDGTPVDFSTFRGKKVLLVNTASECGFTPQYEALQQLHQKYGDKLVVVGLPTNDFGGQEPLDNASIGTFCRRNYGVDFLMLQKCSTRGPGQHPVFAWLTRKQLNGKSSSRVWWNFQKYLVDEQGQLINFYYSFTQPGSRRITRHLEN